MMSSGVFFSITSIKLYLLDILLVFLVNSMYVTVLNFYSVKNNIIKMNEISYFN